MRSTRIVTAATVCVGLLAGLAADAAPQDVVPRPAAVPRAQACPAGQVERGDLGISGLECNCSFYIGEGGERVWLFRSEPVILGVREGGVADGKLREGDAINAIDGILITTGEAGRRYANVEPGERVTLTVRRGERLALIRIEAGTQCERTVEAPDAWHVLVEPVEVVVAPEPAIAVEVEPEAIVELEPAVAVAVEPAELVEAEPLVLVAPHVYVVTRPVFPGGWFGFGISCNCSVHRGESGKPPVWRFKELPEVFSVEPGSPADRGGLQRGDVLVEIDGVSLTDDEGGRRFGAVRPGQTVTFKYRRRGAAVGEVTLTAGERDEPHVPQYEEAEYAELLGQIQEQQMRQQLLTELLLSEAEELAFADELSELLIEEGDTLLEAGPSVGELLAREAELQLQAAENLERLMAGMVEVPVADAPVPEQLRFAGSVGDVDIEVRGGNSVIATVIEEGREIVIVTRDARITIKRSK
ncbi:MAG: PDZ domain-containing protein [Gemmatimonadota bacterium]|nr:MAG: PDZ domain-containing protein [Gemmatimonadota bacterium]